MSFHKCLSHRVREKLTGTLAITKYEKGSHVLYFKSWEMKLPYSSLKFLCILSITNKSLFMKTKGAKLFLCSKRSLRAPSCVLCISFSYLEKTIGKKVHSPSSLPPPSSCFKAWHFFPNFFLCHTPHVTNILLSMVSKRCLQLILTT